MENNLITNLSVCIPSALSMLGGTFGLLYYSHIPTIIVSLLFGLFVLLKGEKSLLSKVFFFLSFSLALWAILDLFTWLSSDTRIIMFTWSITAIIEPLLFILSLYFVYVFMKKEDVAFRYKCILGIIMLPLLAMVPTSLNLSAFDATYCYSLENSIMSYYKYFIELISSFSIIVFSLIKIKQADSSSRKQFIFLFSGIFLFLFSFFTMVFLGEYLINTGYINGYGFEIYGLFGSIIFMGMLAYLIVKFQAFNIKMFGAQALVVGLVILIGSQFFFVRNFTNQILTGITLVLAVVFGWALIRSIKIEVERKNQLQEMSSRLANANDQLRKLDNAKSEFISIASHQLRTPLTAIKGFISLILEGSYGKISKEIGDVLNKVYLSNERLIELVEDLLNLSRIESGRMEYKFEKINLDEVCQEIYDTFVLRAKEKNLDLDLVLNKDLAMEAVTDRNKIREVISNLVDNALKYTNKGGVKIKLAEIEGKIQIAIIDTGIGVPAEEIPYLFTKFSRGKDISRLNAGGTGLGLHVGKKMIEALGGRIWVQSAGTNMGSTFFLEVPKEQGEGE